MVNSQYQRKGATAAANFQAPVERPFAWVPAQAATVAVGRKPGNRRERRRRVGT